MSKGKIERPKNLKLLKERAEKGWEFWNPNHVLWMLDMLERARFVMDHLEYKFEDDFAGDLAWLLEYDGEPNGT